MHKYERVALWAVVAVLAIFSLVIYSSVGTLGETLEKTVAQVEEPTVRPSLLPVVPAEFSDELEKAAPKDEKPSKDGHLWLLVRLTNAGNADTRITAARLDLASAISQVYALTADGKNSEASWGGPKVTKGGVGENSVTLEFPVVSPGQSHLLFVGLRPEGVQGPPYGADAKRWWVDNYPMFWKKLTITAAKGAFDEQETTTEMFGLALAAPTEKKPTEKSG